MHWDARHHCTETTFIIPGISRAKQPQRDANGRPSRCVSFGRNRRRRQRMLPRHAMTLFAANCLLSICPKFPVTGAIRWVCFGLFDPILYSLDLGCRRAAGETRATSRDAFTRAHAPTVVDRRVSTHRRRTIRTCHGHPTQSRSANAAKNRDSLCNEASMALSVLFARARVVLEQGKFIVDLARRSRFLH